MIIHCTLTLISFYLFQQNDEEEDETEYTKQLNQIAIESKLNDEKNETTADVNKNDTKMASEQTDKLEEKAAELVIQQQVDSPSPKPHVSNFIDVTIYTLWYLCYNLTSFFH